MSNGRPLRVLFLFSSSVAVVRHYVSLVSELSERGHDVHLVFPKPPSDRLSMLVDEMRGRSPRVTRSVVPRRRALDGWRSVAWLVRGLADLARYSDPRYEQASTLRRRITGQVLGGLAQPGKFEPVGRRLALRLARRLASTTDAELSARVIRRAARLEDAIPTSRAIDRFIGEWAPDVLLVTPVVKVASSQVDYPKSARRLGIRTGICVASWDNLTNKGLLRFVPERVFVWNEVQRREAVELHGIPTERVLATGAQVFDELFEQRPSGSREDFVRSVGLDPAEPYVLYVCSSSTITQRREPEFVLRWIEALRSSGDDRLRRIGIMVRPHPAVSAGWSDVDLRRFGNAVVWPSRPERPVTDQERSDFFDSLAHSAAVVGLNTTAMIEAAIVGKSVLTVLAPGFGQESTLHFHYLLAENGGFLHVASSLEEHVGQLGGALEEEAADVERRRRFVETFVRPHGLGRAATPILADAVEELAELPVDSPPRGSLPLSVALSLEAGLSSAALVVARLRGGVERLQGTRRLRRAGARARRLASAGPRSRV